MPKPTMAELLRTGFDLIREQDAKCDWELKWPEDIEGQAACIRHLADLAPHVPWAFDKLEDIARDYLQRGEPNSVPEEMFAWSLLVQSGGVHRPKKNRGRPRQFARRDRAIPKVVQWLRDGGASRKDAISQVAKAVSVEPERVERIYDSHREK